MMTPQWAIQLACLYGPILVAVLLALALRPDKRQATALLFATAWNAALLPWFDLAAQSAGLWSYDFDGPRIGAIPLSLYFGWLVAWGICTPLLSQILKPRWWIAVVIMVAIDLRTMPELKPLLKLHTHWWIGELLLIGGLLLPSLFLAHWTAHKKHTARRVAMLAPCFAGLILGLPWLILSPPTADLSQLIPPPLWLFAAFLLAVPGMSAMRDLALSGDGTPVPLDPPRLLVTHGIYGYLRNPMQWSVTTLLLLEATYLQSLWPAALAVIGVIYSEGFARWSEGHDMSRRFGNDWQRYRTQLRFWWPRWTPVIPSQACELWIDLACGHCSTVARWFQKRQSSGLIIRNARDWPGETLYRITWRDPVSGRCESGIKAMAMGFGHLTLPWAALGWIASTPGLSAILQCCFDAAGAGPHPACQLPQPRPPHDFENRDT